MKKIAKRAFFIALGLAPAVFFSPVYAAGLPPGNPFYPFQKGLWQLQRVFTFNPIAKVLLEIRLVNERQIDIARLLVVRADESAFVRAFQAYSDELKIFSEQIKGIQDNTALTGAAQIFIEHTAFFNDVLGNSAVVANDDLRAQVIAIKEMLAQVALGIFENSAGGAFRTRIRAAAVSAADPFKELRAVEALIALEDKTLSADALKKIEFAKDSILAVFIGKVKRGDIAVEKIDWIQGNALARFEALDAARSLVNDLETRNVLIRARARALKQAEINHAITPVAVRELINYVKNISETFGVSNEQKIYFIEQASVFFENAGYSIAFQHAVSARGAVMNLLMEKTVAKKDLQEEIMVLKTEYDEMKKSIFMEKRIAALADMIGRFPTGTILAAIREVKLTLAFSDN